MGLRPTLVERWNGRAWSIVPSPNLSHGKVSLSNVLASVSCSSATNCFAVGSSYYFRNRTLILHWDGKTWTIVTSPDGTATGNNMLEGVSCPDATHCLAVGETSAKSNQPSSRRTLTERWNGTKWSVVPSPNAPSGVGDLASVSCASATRCVAVGASSASSLIETWNGVGWTRAASADPASATHNALEGVSCVSATSCFAVGTQSGSSGLHQPLTKMLSGTHWSNVTAASPGGAQNSDLHAVSCAKATSCTAVGEYDTTGAPLTLVERYA